jgi:hypothetical protein
MAMAFVSYQHVNAQINLNDVLSGVMNKAAASSGDSSAADAASSVLDGIFSSSKQADAKKIIGTWAYKEPAIVLSADNLLAKAAYKVAEGKVEKELQNYLTKYGIAPGKFSMTFNEDGTCSETINGKTAKGTWQIVDSKLQLSFQGVKAVSITTQIGGKDMQLVTDATKLLNMFKTFGANSSNQNIKTVASLLKSAKGMQAGITLRKQ